MDIEREDLQGQHVDATLKPMPTGEVVARMRTNVPGMETKRVSVTKAAFWSDRKNPPWQNPHLHKGMQEGYFLVKGWMIVVWGGGDSKIITYRDSIPCVEFKPGLPHNVLLGPEAEVVVWQRQVGGEPILNHDMSEPQDRWPCPNFNFDPSPHLWPEVEELLTHFS